MFLINKESHIVHIRNITHYSVNPVCGAYSYNRSIVKKFAGTSPKNRFCKACMNRLNSAEQRFFKRAFDALNKIAKEEGVYGKGISCKYPKCSYYKKTAKYYCCNACSGDHYDYKRLYK